MKINFTIKHLLASFLLVIGALPMSLNAADVNFISPPDVCVSAGIQTGLGGGIPTGGVYSGLGVIDNNNGTTFSFDPSLTGAGNTTIFYTLTDGGTPFEVCAVIMVYEAPTLPEPLSIEVCEGESTLITPTSSGPGCTEFVEIWSESFETDGEGTRYDATLNTIGGADTYFVRTDGTGFSANGGANYTGKVGNYYWAGEYHDSPTVGNTDPSLEIFFSVNDITVITTGYSSLLFKGLIAANPNSPFLPGTYPSEPNNYLNILYQMDATIPLPFIQFSPSGTGNGLSLDTNFDGVGDCDLLTPQFQEFTVPLAVTGNIFNMRMRMHSDAVGEEWAIDNFRIYGEQPTSCLFNFYNANPNAGPATLLAEAVSSYDPATTAANSPQSIWVTEVNQNGCESPAREVVVTVTSEVTVTFTAPTLDVCIEDNITTGLSGGSPLGGQYSGDGVSDNGNGTFDFDPAATSGGFIPVTYTYSGVGGCIGSASDDIYVNPICCETFEITCPPDIFVNNQSGQCGRGLDIPQPTIDEACDIISLVARYRLVDINGNPLGPWSFGSLDPSGFYDVGRWEMEWRADQAGGEFVTCSFYINVLDNQAPTGTCQNLTVELDINQSASVSGSDIVTNASDNCSAPTLNIISGQSTYDCDDLGQNFPVTVQITDGTNSISCNATISVTDPNTNCCPAPVAVCQNFTAQLNASGNVTINTIDIDNGSTAGCGLASITLSDNSYTCGDVGTTTVTLTITDLKGNFDQCTANLTIEDNVAPNAICDNEVVVLNAAGMASISANQINDGSTDACGIASLSLNKSTFTCADIGLVPVTLTVTDIHGNSNSCFGTVDVQDNTIPTAICANVTVEIDINQVASVTAAQIAGASTDNCNPPSLSISNGQFSYTCADIGTAFPVTVTVADNGGNSTGCTGNVTVLDPNSNCCAAPVAICQNLTVQLNASGLVSLAANDINNGSTAECGLQSLSANVSSFNCSNIGGNPVILTITDINSESDQCTATVTVEDNVAPVALCQNITVQLNAAGSASISGSDVDNGSNDACGIAGLSASTTSFSCSNVGPNSVTLTATDVNGSASTCSATVTVEDNVAPVALCQNITVQLNAAGSASISGSDVDNGSNDACGIAGLGVSTTSFNCSNVGPNSVTLTATDANGNSSTCSATVTVEDNAGPTALCQNITVQLNAAGSASITAPEIDGGSGDACGLANLSAAPTTFSCANVGPNLVTLTATDINGNASTCSATVTVEDNVAPVALCQNITVQLNAAGSASISGSDVDNGSNDACGIAGLSASTTSFSCSNVGPNLVTLTTTDVNGNASTCSATVTVEDNVAPVALCQNITVQLNAAGNAAITAGDIDDGSNDACGIAGLGVSTTSFNCSNVGPNSVTLTATDVNGNASTCSATVTVEDNAGPTALCQNITVQLNAAGSASITAPEIDGGSGDACGLANLSATPTTFSCANVGPNLVTLTATDINGNASTCSATVTVEDNVAPVALCQNITVQLNAAGSASISGSDVDNGSNDACGIAGLSASTTSFSCSNVGPNSVTLTATDVNGNASTCSATVTVEDNVAPVALCQNITVQLNAAGNAAITAGDIDDGSNDACGIAGLGVSTTSFNCSNVGPNSVTLTATDVNGNSSTCSATVTVEDNAGPTALCQNITVQLNAAGNAAITAPEIDGGSGDACGLANLSAAPTTFSCANVGSNLVTLTATDINGNVSTCGATVTVEDNVAPVALCQNITVQLNAAGSASISGSDVDNGSNDACGIAGLSASTTSFSCSNVGPNSVTLTATDVNGNASTCSATVTVEDNVAPVALCQNITVQLNAAGNASIIGADIDNGSSDACGVNLSVAPEIFLCENVGDNPVTLTVSDDSGNSSTCSATVTVEDNVGPQANCQNITVQLNDNGIATIVATDIDGGTNDACGEVSLSIEITDFDCADVGPNTVELTTTDVNGNSGSCNAIVTVEDLVQPLILVCKGGIIVFHGEEEIPSLEGMDFDALDACGIASVTYTPEVVTCGQVGQLVNVMVAVTDQNGNVSNCSSNVTVDGLPCGWNDLGNDGIGCEDSSFSDYDPDTETFTLESNGCYSSNFTMDDAAYIYSDLCGNGEIIVHVSSLNGLGWAGITMRETAAPGSKKVALMTNLGNFVRREVRYTTNGYAYPQQSFKPNTSWLRLVRAGNQFIGYTSSNGISWQISMGVNLPMNNCIQVGLIVTNANGNNVVSAEFDQISITQGGGFGLSTPNTDGIHQENSPVTQADFQLSPNPTTGEAWVNLQDYVGQKAEIKIYNKLGQVVLQKTIQEVDYQPEHLQLNALSNGTYFIEVISDQGRQIKKLLVVGQKP